MRNTEQVIGSVGLMSYQCGALKELNAKLSELGPGTFKDNYDKGEEGTRDSYWQKQCES